MGLQDGRPYEVFTGKIEEDAMYIPPKIKKGFIIKVREEDGTKRYDFQYTDRYGYTNTIGGISRLFNEEFWNYAKLISGVLRHGMPIEKTVSLDRVPAPGQRVDQHLEDGRMPRVETVHRRWHEVQGQVPELRSGEHGLSERMPDLYKVRLFQVRMILRRMV